MMCNILVYLLMLKSRFSIVWQSCDLQQDLLCSNQIKPVERSEKTIPPPTASCARIMALVVPTSKYFLLILSWCHVRAVIYLIHPSHWFHASCLHRWPLPVPVPCLQKWCCSLPAHSDPGVITPTSFISPSSLSPQPGQSQPHSAPCGVPKPLQGCDTGFGCDCYLFMLNIAGFGWLGLHMVVVACKRTCFKQGKVLDLAISRRENCLGFWIIGR